MVISKKYFNSCTLYILLWALYSLQGTFYAEGSIISQGLLAIIMLQSVYYTYKVVTSEKNLPPFIKVLNCFLILITIYGIVALLDSKQVYIGRVLSGSVHEFVFLKSAYMSLLPIYVFFYFFKQGVMTDRIVQLASVLLLFATTSLFIHNQNILLEAAMDMGSTREEFTNNIAYNFLQLLPLAFFWNKKPLMQYLYAAYILVFLVAGMKRGALIIGAVCFLWFMYRSIKSSRGWNKAIVVLLAVAITIFGVNYVVEFSSTSDYFQQRLQQTAEGNSSGRDVIFGSLWEHFLNEQSALKILFGNGAMQTIKIIGNYAHNDWLEILICHGIVGVLIYILYFISLIKHWLKSKGNAVVYNVLGMTIAIMFASTLFSMSYNSLSLGITLCLGYCLGQSQQKNTIPYARH